MGSSNLSVLGFIGVMFAVVTMVIGVGDGYAQESYPLMNSGVVSERPDFGPAQIRSMDQLRYGVPVMMCRSDVCSAVRRVVRAPYVDDDGSMRIVIFLNDPERGFRNESVSLADYGVIPYPGGGWNALNWLRRITE